MADDATPADRQSAWDDWLSILSPRARAVASRGVADSPPPEYGWWLIVTDELDPEPKMIRASSCEDLARRLRELPANSVGLPFMGAPLQTAGSADSDLRYLVDPGGGLIPLFRLPEQVRVDNARFLSGGSPALPDVDLPPRPAVTPPATSDAEEADGYDEEDEEDADEDDEFAGLGDR